MGSNGDVKAIETNDNPTRNRVQGDEEQAAESGGKKRGQVDLT